MIHLLLLSLALGDDPTLTSRPHKPNPLAPSLAELTDEEEKKLDEVIDRFIRYDSGQSQGLDPKRIMADFHKLTPDAIPALIRGLNRAAKIEHSCPAVTIAKKLAQMLNASRDPELLEYVRENVGAGVSHSVHMGVIKDLRIVCLLRKRTLANVGISAYVPPAINDLPHVPQVSEKDEFRRLSNSDLIRAVGEERGARLKLALTELGSRRGEGVIGALGSAATSYAGDIRRLARDLLERQLSKMSEADLRKQFNDDHAEVRALAVRLAGQRGLHLEKEIIELLDDAEGSVRQAARRALAHLAHGEDFGPHANANDSERAAAKQQWLDWLARKGNS